MKSFKYIYSLITVMLFMTACQDEEMIPTIEPALVGDEIVFGARAGFENNAPNSRTVYSGVTYTYNGKTYERIDWENGVDMIEIYSPQASDPGSSESSNSHYNIVSGADDSDTESTDDHLKDYATLQRIEGAGSSLQWQGDEDHTFYALYPSQRMFDTEDSEGNKVTVDMGIELNNGILNGVIPSFQNPKKIVTTETGYEAKPDMRYAYMAAKTVANRNSGNVVGLTFVPFVTAVEIELLNPEGGDPIYIGEIQIANENSPIAGAFSADLIKWNVEDSRYPKCTVGEEKGNIIQISTRLYNSTTQIEEPIKLNANQTLKFTVFILPTQDLSNLTVRYSDTGATEYLSKTLDFSKLDTSLKVLPAHVKTKITKLNLPKPATPFVLDASNWMSQLPQETTLRKLSIPGTGGSFSYNYTGANPDYYKQQTLTLEEQWKLGIRAFEVISDRSQEWVSTGIISGEYKAITLATENATCNKTSVGTTVGAIFDNLIAKVTAEGSTECAFVILTYQPEGNDPSRNATRYAQSLKLWFDDVAKKDVFAKYTPDMTLADAQNKIMVLVRLNQKDEKDNGSFAGASAALEGYPFVLIDGCGTAKDRWGARGYKVNGNNFPDISNSYDDYDIIETFMEEGYVFSSTSNSYTSTVNSAYTITRAAADTPTALNFGFATNDASVTCWYQEWARVVFEPYIREQSWFNSACYWFESYNEKLKNATLTYDMAVSDSYSNYIFINSLCGYLLTEAFEDSYVQSTGGTYGGSGGDIAGLAAKITPAFYNHVLERSKENTTGPTGIVMMDYLSDDPATGGSYYLPGLIIANNFKHNQ